MDTKGKDGVPYRVHLEKNATGIVPDLRALDELENEPPLPELTADIWIQFRQIEMRRMYNENGPMRFTWESIDAFMAVTGIRLGRWYLKTLFALDDAFFTVRAENKE